MDYINDFPYKEQKVIIRNDDVYQETQEAGDVAYDIVAHVKIILKNMPEFDDFIKQTGMHWFMVSWPVPKGLDQDIYESCRDVLDFANTLNSTHYEEIGMWADMP